MLLCLCFFFFFFNDTATTEIYTLSLHDALPIDALPARGSWGEWLEQLNALARRALRRPDRVRSEEHTSELQSRENLVCRLLLEKKKQKSPDREQVQKTNEQTQ